MSEKRNDLNAVEIDAAPVVTNADTAEKSAEVIGTAKAGKTVKDKKEKNEKKPKKMYGRGHKKKIAKRCLWKMWC